MSSSTVGNKLADLAANRLLILGCSQSKRNTEALAIDLYDGPQFKVVRKYLAEEGNLDVLVLSARHGLITSDCVVQPYNQRLSKGDFNTLSGTVSHQWASMRVPKAVEICVCCPKMYCDLIRPSLAEYVEGVEYVIGPQGEVLSRLWSWLRKAEAPKRRARARSGGAVFQNSRLDWSSEELREAAILVKAAQAPHEFKVRWLAAVEEIEVPAKRLASVLSKIPAAHFETGQALGYLSNCGIRLFERGGDQS